MQRYTIGVDIGGTKIQAGLVSDKNKIVKSQRYPINKQSGKKTVQSITNAIQPLFSKNIRSIGLGITGHVELKSGVVRESANLPADWKNVPLGHILKTKFKVPVVIDNDAHCIALAEAMVGAGRSHSVVLGVTIGTGIGCGLIINRKIYRGTANIIEFGHTIISDDKQARCHCGGYGHFEALVSGPAMTRHYRELTGKIKTPWMIESEARLGRLAAKKVFSRMAVYLARGLANAICSYNPGIIILGGGLGKIGLLVRPAARLVNKYLFYSGLKKTRIVMSRLNYDAGIIGAALITKKAY